MENIDKLKDIIRSMGYLTTFTVYNDGSDQFEKNAKNFAEIIYHACYSNKTRSYALGYHTNLIKAQKTRHADDHTIYVHMGNTVSEMNAYAIDTEELMRNNPEYFKRMLHFMETNVKDMKKRFKEIVEENKK